MLFRIIPYICPRKTKKYKTKQEFQNKTIPQKVIAEWGIKIDSAMMRIGLGNTCNGTSFAPHMYYSARKSILDNPDKYPDDVVSIAKKMKVEDIDNACVEERLKHGFSSDNDSYKRSSGRSGRSKSSSNNDYLF